MTFSVNFDISNTPAWESATPEQIYGWGFRGVRYVSRESNAERTAAVKAAGLQEMAVVTWESDGFVPDTADWVQIHNERVPQSGQSGLMTPEQYAYEYTTYRSVFGHRPQHRWALQGLNGGPTVDIPFLQQFFNILANGGYPSDQTHVDAIALHLYTHSASSARQFCDDVWNLFQIPVICTEWYRSAVEGHWDFQCMLNGDGGDGQGARCGTWNSVFCLSDHMTWHTEGTKLGLLDLDGQPKPEFYSLLSSPCNGSESLVQPPEPAYAPTVLHMRGTVAGAFQRTPRGVILHGSRSGRPERAGHAEFVGTANYAASGAGGLGWNATVGDDEIALHMPMRSWGWNARAASDDYLAVELAQPVEATDITDAQVRAFCWFVQEARKAWPSLPFHFPTHAELDGNETGARDGKTDVFRKGSLKTDDLRERIMARLNDTLAAAQAA